MISSHICTLDPTSCATGIHNNLLRCWCMLKKEKENDKMLGWITFWFIILWISLYGWGNSSIPFLNWRLASSQKMAAFTAVVINLFKTKTYYVMHVYLQNNYNAEILVTRLWYQDLQRFVNPGTTVKLTLPIHGNFL